MRRLKNKQREKQNEAVWRCIGEAHADALVEEALKLQAQEGDVLYPERLNRWFETFQKRKKYSREGYYYLKKVAMVFVTLSVVATSLSIASESFREKLFNLFISEYDTHAEGRIIGDAVEGRVVMTEPVSFDLSYLPEGYRQTEAFDVEDMHYLVFENGDKEQIKFMYKTLPLHFTVDAEDTEVLTIDIKGNEGIAVEKEDFTIVIWFDEQFAYQLTTKLPLQESLKIARGVH